VDDGEAQQRHADEVMAAHRAKLEQRRLKNEALSQTPGYVPPPERPKKGRYVMATPPPFMPKPLMHRVVTTSSFKTGLPLDMIAFCCLQMRLRLEELEDLGILDHPAAKVADLLADLDIPLQ